MKTSEEPLCIVPVTVYPPAKTERINITAPGDQIAEITDYAKHNKLSRSELMVKAALNYIRSNALTASASISLTCSIGRVSAS